MIPKRHDFSIFDNFNFEQKPVGIKFLLNKPEAIEKIDKKISICQMFREAQERKPFYADEDNFACLETLLMGLTEHEPFYESGQIGEK